MPKRITAPATASAGRVHILKKVKVAADNWRLCPARIEANGKLRDFVIVNGVEEHHPEGTYYIEWYERGKRRREAIPNKNEVLDRARRKRLELDAKEAGIQVVGGEVVAEKDQRTVTTTLITWLDDFRRSRSKNSHSQYRSALKAFTEFLGDDRITFADLKNGKLIDAYAEQLRDDDTLAPSSARNRLVILGSFLKQNGLPNVVKLDKLPKVTSSLRRPYEHDEVSKLIQHAGSDLARLAFKLLLVSGFRENEASFARWRDVDFQGYGIRVTAKPNLGFTPKDYEERYVPLPKTFVEQLAKHKAKKGEVSPYAFVLGNGEGRRPWKLLDAVKRAAFKAGLNCGHCVTRYKNKCNEGPYCANFNLHKFRHTFATEHLRHGVDIYSLKTWLGHSNLETTMIYLKSITPKDAQQKVNTGALAGLIA